MATKRYKDIQGLLEQADRFLMQAKELAAKRKYRLTLQQIHETQESIDDASGYLDREAGVPCKKKEGTS